MHELIFKIKLFHLVSINDFIIELWYNFRFRFGSVVSLLCMHARNFTTKPVMNLHKNTFWNYGLWDKNQPNKNAVRVIIKIEQIRFLRHCPCHHSWHRYKLCILYLTLLRMNGFWQQNYAHKPRFFSYWFCITCSKLYLLVWLRAYGYKFWYLSMHE